jgi:hypothetical protein
LVEIEPVAEVSSRLIVNRPALKTRPEEVGGWIERFREAIGHRRPSLTTAAPPLSRAAGEGAECREAGEGR